jgi:hypothetical protein
LSNAHILISVTLPGIATLSKELQALNANNPIVVTPLGIVMLVKELHPENEFVPMVVTLLGIIVFLQPKTNVFVVVSIIALQLSLESYTEFPSSTTMFDKELLLPKEPLIWVTFLGIVIEVREEQFLNVLNPMKFTLRGINIVVKDVQLLNA